jgi:hypothetical protein
LLGGVCYCGGGSDSNDANACGTVTKYKSCDP